ncbi:MAG: hypothetical protein ACK58T_36700, partial [Phycisphaerae bacterium]
FLEDIWEQTTERKKQQQQWDSSNICETEIQTKVVSQPSLGCNLRCIVDSLSAEPMPRFPPWVRNSSTP